jgi:hypothetical protein
MVDYLDELLGAVCLKASVVNVSVRRVTTRSAGLLPDAMIFAFDINAG